MKRYFLIAFLFNCINQLPAQGQWVWISGDKTTDENGVMGAQGIPSTLNKPAARYESLEWVDKYGRLWLYGGVGGSGRFLYDMWMYNPLNGTWVWMNGNVSSARVAPIFGDKGVSSVYNNPGIRNGVANTWTDVSGNLWLFGGTDPKPGGPAIRRNDLWMFDADTTSPTYNQWTWIAGDSIGDQPGRYGIKGIYDINNKPPARAESAAGWVDNEGNLWLFGGLAGSVLSYNDLWKFDLNPGSSTYKQWAWMHGDTIVSQPSIYGTQGVPSPANKPGGRAIYSNWKDNSGNLWMYGGFSFVDITTKLVLKELWKFNVSTSEWTWINGNASTTASYGIKCETTPTNQPTEKFKNRVEWKDKCGNLYMFGGGNNNANHFTNDLWKYNPNTNQWTWISGDKTPNTSGFYGTKGTASPVNKPGARVGAVGWQTNEGYWIFGGQIGGSTSSDYINDLWKYIPDKPTVDFSSTGDCEVSFLSIVNPGCDEVESYLWDFGDVAAGSENTSSLPNPTHKYGSNGMHTVKLVVTNCMGMKDSLEKTITTSVPTANAGPNISINEGETVQLSGNGGTTYRWEPASSLSCSTCPNPLASPSETTTYILTVSDALGCENSDTVVVNVLKKEIVLPAQVNIPNIFTPNGDGVNDHFNIITQGVNKMNCKVYNRYGNLMYEGDISSPHWDGKEAGDGVYYYVVSITENSGKEYDQSGMIQLIRR